MSEALDPELLAALLPEWQDATDRLAAAATPSAIARALDTLRGLAGSADIAVLRDAMRAFNPLPDPFDPAAAAATLRAAGRRLGGESPEEEPETTAAAPGPSPVRTLIVDDSAMMRRLVRGSLDVDPAFVVIGEAADGREALARIAVDRPDLILLDIEMPVLDGLGVLREWALSGHPGGTGAVVVISSAATPGGEVSIEARRLGAAAVVGKPSGAFSPDLADRQGEALRRAARRAAGLPAAP
ncbi:response regulator [Muricoccus radiodurans]|uniref:response regulator n=1 Tax=Muricoccus radiodurans TaxID=2231721 RepID=UPI003CF4E122